MSKNLFKPSDLYWMVVWLIERAYYSILPIPVLVKSERLKGLIKSFFSAERPLIRKNLISILGDFKTDAEIEAIMRRYFGYLEEFELMFRLPKLRGFRQLKYCPVEGLHHLDSAIARGKGVIILSTHFGYTRLIKHFLRVNGFRLSVVGARESKRVKAEKRERKQAQSLTTFRRFLRDRLRVSAEVASERDLFADLNVRPLVEVLNQGGILLIPGDTHHSAHFVDLPFLGNVYPFPTGFMKLAMATGAALLPAFAIEASEGFGVKVVIEKPLNLESKSVSKQAVANNLKQYVDLFEAYVRRYPHLFKIWDKEGWFEERLARSRKEVEKRY